MWAPELKILEAHKKIYDHYSYTRVLLSDTATLDLKMTFSGPEVEHFKTKCN